MKPLRQPLLCRPDRKTHKSICAFGTCGEPAEKHVSWGTGCANLCKHCARKVERTAVRQHRYVQVTDLKGQQELSVVVDGKTKGAGA